MSHNEQLFLELWQNYSNLIEPLPKLQAQIKPVPGRKYAVDFAIQASRIAIEIQGGTYMFKSGHKTASGLNRDYEKLNLCQANGWVVFQLSGDMLNFQWIKEIVECHRSRIECKKSINPPPEPQTSLRSAVRKRY